MLVVDAREVVVEEALTRAERARSAGSSWAIPSTEASAFTISLRRVSTCSPASAAGGTSIVWARAAPIPAASPSTAQVAITRVEPKATWLAEMFRPAIHMFVTFFENSTRSGRW